MSIKEPMLINGCRITVSFAETADPTINQDVSEMLIESFLRRCGD